MDFVVALKSTPPREGFRPFDDVANEINSIVIEQV